LLADEEHAAVHEPVAGLDFEYGRRCRHTFD
jgi:hypothetical protein